MDHRLRDIVEQATELAAEYGATLASHQQNKKARVALRIEHGDEHRTLFWPMDQGNWRTNRNLETQARRVLEAWLGPPKVAPKAERITPDPHSKDAPRGNGQHYAPRPMATQPLDRFTSPFESRMSEVSIAVLDSQGREVCRAYDRQSAVWLVERLNSAKVPMHRREKSVGVSTLQSLAGEYRRRESHHLNSASEALDAQDLATAEIEKTLADAFGFAAGTLESLIQAEVRPAKSKEEHGEQSQNAFAMSGLR